MRLTRTQREILIDSVRGLYSQNYELASTLSAAIQSEESLEKILTWIEYSKGNFDLVGEASNTSVNEWMCFIKRVAREYK